MSELDDSLINLMGYVVYDGRVAWSTIQTIKKLEAQKDEIKKDITNHLLDLVEQSKEKSLPLHWLAGEIKKL
jgi:hypothetical protein